MAFPASLIQHLIQLRGDLIEMFKMSKDIETFNNMFKLNNLNCLRKNKFKVYKECCKSKVRKYFLIKE